jgi:hypothetical protein
MPPRKRSSDTHAAPVTTALSRVETASPSASDPWWWGALSQWQDRYFNAWYHLASISNSWNHALGCLASKEIKNTRRTK